ncbi:MAG: hypothetical protein P9L97_05840 [Candidatus Tenebribacter davisii]|nr:hypothetical protein [Candidatus Tenebribacter davisii]
MNIDILGQSIIVLGDSLVHFGNCIMYAGIFIGIGLWINGAVRS